MSSPLIGNIVPSDRDSWWDKTNRLESLSQSPVQGLVGQSDGNNESFSQSLENILARADSIQRNDGLNIAQAAPTTVTGEAVTFEELINSQNAQIREFAVLDQQPLSPDWSVLGNPSPVTPSNFKALEGLSDSLMLSQRFANAIYAVR